MIWTRFHHPVSLFTRANFLSSEHELNLNQIDTFKSWGVLCWRTYSICDTLCFTSTDGSYYSISQSLRADLNISSSYPSSVEETIFRLQDLFRRTGMFNIEGLWWLGDIFFYLSFIKMVTIWIYAIVERKSYLPILVSKRSCDVCLYGGTVVQTITERHTNGKILEKRISNEGEKAEKRG